MNAYSICLLSVLLIIDMTSGFAQFDDGKTERPILTPGYSERFVNKVISDRPSMRNLWEGSQLFRCSVMASLSSTAQHAEWDDSEPKLGRPSEFEIRPGQTAVIRMTNQGNLKCNDLWFLLVFELNNANYREEFLALDLLVERDEISCEEFIDSCIQLELIAMVKTLEFFRNYMLTSAESFDSRLYESFLGVENSSLERYYKMLDKYTGKVFDTRDYYREAYKYLRKNSSLRGRLSVIINDLLDSAQGKSKPKGDRVNSNFELR